MADVENILDLLDPRGRALQKARALNSNAMSFPQPPNTGSIAKDFLLNALQTAPMGIGARPSGGPITGGRSFQMLNEMTPTVVNNPGSATDLSLRMGGSSPPFNRSQQGPSVGEPANINQFGAIPSELNKIGSSKDIMFSPAENSNRYNPKVNDILSFLSKENIPINQVKDTTGGTSYIKVENPHAAKDNITIRVPSDNHIGTRGYRNDPGDFFDLGTKATKGSGQKPNYTQNAEGIKYGEDPTALQDAIKYRFGKDLVSPGREPKNKPQKTAENPKENLNMDDLISTTLKDMEKPQTTNNEIKDMSQTIDQVLRKYEFMRD